MENEQIAIRIGTLDDLSFVYSSWLKSYLETSLFTRGVPRQLAFQNHRKIVASIIDKAHVYVAHPLGESDQILGYVVAEKLGTLTIIHYAYVKAAYRRFGVARRLIATTKKIFNTDSKLPMMASHMTDMGRYLKGQSLVYNPYLLITGDYYEDQKFEARTGNQNRAEAPGRKLLVS